MKVKKSPHQETRQVKDYTELDPISPIKISFTMQRQSPERKHELIAQGTRSHHGPSNIAVVQQYVELLQSTSDVVKFEAASCLFHILDIESAVIGKVYNYITSLMKEKTLRHQ